jgi:hypothetical protein
MKSVFLVLISTLAAAVPCTAAAPSRDAVGSWRVEVEAGVRALAAAEEGAPVSEAVLALALDAAARDLGARSPEEATPLVYEAAVRAELRHRLGETMPRIGAELRQEFRIAARAGADATERLRVLERLRSRFEREHPGAGSMPWWMGPGNPRGRWRA